MSRLEFYSNTEGHSPKHFYPGFIQQLIFKNPMAAVKRSGCGQGLGNRGGAGGGKGVIDDSLGRLYNSKLSACGTGPVPGGCSPLVSAVL